jgi:hypothetical protein
MAHGDESHVADWSGRQRRSQRQRDDREERQPRKNTNRGERVPRKDDRDERSSHRRESKARNERNSREASRGEHKSPGRSGQYKIEIRETSQHRRKMIVSDSDSNESNSPPPKRRPRTDQSKIEGESLRKERKCTPVTPSNILPKPDHQTLPKRKTSAQYSDVVQKV